MARRPGGALRGAAVTPQLKRRIWLVLEDTHADLWYQRAVEVPLVLMILANVAAVAAETVQPFASEHEAKLRAFEVFSVVVFTIEYLARVWICTENPAFSNRSAWKTRIFYIGSPFAVIDLLAILPFYVSLLFPVFDLRILRVFRLLRLLKLARYSPALATLSRRSWRFRIFSPASSRRPGLSRTHDFTSFSRTRGSRSE